MAMRTHDYRIGQHVLFSHGGRETPAIVREMDDKNNLRLEIEGWLGLQWYPAGDCRDADQARAAYNDWVKGLNTRITEAVNHPNPTLAAPFVEQAKKELREYRARFPFFARAEMRLAS
jgi:hypothetical protein